MTFQVEITPIAESQIEKAYQWYKERNPEFADRWFRELMNAIATLQEKPRRFSLAVEHQIFNEEVRQLLYGKSKNIYRVLFTIRGNTVYILYVRHGSQAPMTTEDLEDGNYSLLLPKHSIALSLSFPFIQIRDRCFSQNTRSRFHFPFRLFKYAINVSFPKI
jgi:plasmid stabilization system protein ParE